MFQCVCLVNFIKSGTGSQMWGNRWGSKSLTCNDLKTNLKQCLDIELKISKLETNVMIFLSITFFYRYKLFCGSPIKYVRHFLRQALIEGFLFMF